MSGEQMKLIKNLLINENIRAAILEIQKIEHYNFIGKSDNQFKDDLQLFRRTI